MVTAFVILIITCLFIGLRQIPRMRINRPAGALVGAVLMIVTGVLVLPVEVRIAQGAETAAPASVPRTVRIEAGKNPAETRTYTVVLFCDSEEKRVRGLQGFRRLKPDEAALFFFDPPEQVAFWMGDVAYPLDIIFVDPTGRVAAVFAGLRPGNKNLYPAPFPARWVVETAAGSGIRAGDSVVVE